MKFQILEESKNELNSQQLEAVKQIFNTSLLIAGAGTGKTLTLCHCVANLLSNSIDAKSVMMVTFTKKAAREMEDRIHTLVGEKSRGLNVGTFHRIANKYFKQYYDKMKFRLNFSYSDDLDAKQRLKYLRNQRLQELEQEYKEKENDNEYKINSENYPSSTEILKIYHNARILPSYARDFNLKSAITQYVKKTENYKIYLPIVGFIHRILEHYESTKLNENTVDYTDLLVFFLKLLKLEKFKEIKNSIIEEVRHLFVDEFQDVNALQYAIVDEIGRKAETFFVIGDDAQAIYHFRGANIYYIQNFSENHDNSTTKVLEENYRSTQAILDCANRILKMTPKLKKKDLFSSKKIKGVKPKLITCQDEEHEAYGIVSNIQENLKKGIPFNEQGILIREKKDASLICNLLDRLDIPYELRAGQELKERKIVKDALAFISCALNPYNFQIWYRIFDIIPGIGDITAAKIVKILTEKSQIPSDSERTPFDIFVVEDVIAFLHGEKINKKAKKNLRFLKKILNTDINKIRLNHPRITVEQVLQKIKEFLNQFCHDRYGDRFNKAMNELETLSDMSISYKNNFELFLEDYYLDSDIIKDTKKRYDEQPLIISTIHQAKGLEWDHIFIPNVIGLRFPHSLAKEQEELEEEIRLFYVAITRAKSNFTLFYPKKILHMGSYINTSKSPYIDQIKSYLTHIEDKEIRNSDFQCNPIIIKKDHQILWLESLPRLTNSYLVSGQIKKEKEKSILFKIKDKNPIWIPRDKCSIKIQRKKDFKLYINENFLLEKINNDELFPPENKIEYFYEKAELKSEEKDAKVIKENISTPKPKKGLEIFMKR